MTQMEMARKGIVSEEMKRLPSTKVWMWKRFGKR